MPKFIPKRNENIHPQNPWYTHFHSSSIYNSQTVETPQMFINLQMNKCISVVHTMEY